MPDTPTATSDNSDVRVQQAQAFQPLPPPTSLKAPGSSGRPHEDRPTKEVLGALAVDKPVSESEATSALEWFLSEEPDEETELTHTVEINVGVGEQQNWISWVVRPIDGDELRRIQRTTNALRRRGRQDDIAIDQLGNLKVIVAGSVEPDIEAIAQEQGKQPEAILLSRFKKKPGLIAQLATQIMALSGFDDEDVRDALSAKN